MKCQYCQMNDATVNMTMQINNQRMQMHLCNDCFQDFICKMSNSAAFFSGDHANDAFFCSFFQAGWEGQTRTRTKQNTNEREGLLDQLGKNVTGDARAGLVDYVIGRDNEIKPVGETLH